MNLNGALSGGGGLIKGQSSSDTGILNLNSLANNYAGTTTLNDGTLGGAGTIPGSLTIGSGTTLSPGSGSGPAILNVNGTVTFSAGSTYNDLINGPVAGSGYSQLNVAGSVALNGAPKLILSGTGGVPTGTALTLIHDTGGISGTFSSPLLNTSQVNPSALTYTGETSGHDLILNEVDQAPIVSTNGSVSYTQGVAAVAISPNISVSDIDSANLVSATVTISSGFLAGDTLNFTPVSGITATVGSGLITFTGSASPAAYQTLLRSITYSSSSQNPTNYGTDLSRTITWTVNDGTLASTAVTTNVTVVPVDAASVVTTTAATLNYTELSGPQAIDPGVTVTDVDNQNLVSATVTISSGFISTLDTLSQTASLTGTGVTFNYTPGTNFATLTGTASTSVYQTLLQGIAYTTQ